MKTITTQKQIILNEVEDDCHSYANERVGLTRVDDPGQKSFLAMEFINLEPTEEYPVGCLTFTDAEDLHSVFLESLSFLRELQEGQDENGDIVDGSGDDEEKKNIGLNYANIATPHGKGWLNLFFGDDCLCLVGDVDIADNIRVVVAERLRRKNKS